MDALSHVLEAVGLVLAILDFTGWSRKLETILDRAHEGFRRLLEYPLAIGILMLTGGIVLILALWIVWAVFWVINKPAVGIVGSIGLILAVTGFVIGLAY